MSGSPLSALKSLTNSGKMGGDAGPSSTGPLYGGGATTGGINMGNHGINPGWIALLAAILVIGGIAWLFLR